MLQSMGVKLAMDRSSGYFFIPHGMFYCNHRLCNLWILDEITHYTLAEGDIIECRMEEEKKIMLN